MSELGDSALVALVVGVLTATGGWITARASARKAAGDEHLARATATSTYAEIDRQRLEALERDLERARLDREYANQAARDTEKKLRLYREGAERLRRQLIDASLTPDWTPPSPNSG